MSMLKNFWQKQNTLERKLFWSTLAVVIIVAILSAVFTIYEDMNSAASIGSVGCALVCFIVAVFAYKSSFYSQCYFVMCLVLGGCILPLLFLFCGGFTGGLPLYFVASLMLIAYTEKSAYKVIAFVVTMVLQLTAVGLSWVHPEWVLSELGRDDSYLDMVVSLLFSGFAVFSISTLTVSAYAHERAKNAKLLARMDYLSSRDSLTEVYNRRHMSSFLANVVWHHRNDFYLLMLNIDNLKRVNETFGHAFGDQVIMSVAHLLDSSADLSSNECVGRYDGDTFVYVIEASSEVEAYAKADRIRKSVIQTRWEDFPHIQVTVSGGFAFCGNRSFHDYRQMLAKVEELMKVAKSQGKNQLRSMVEN
ncbi:MAG: GGDEF domain-containing protein [Fibrobacter sp.]|nr:GGDEF domain-containing protein [Fibrobacter sp.]